MRSTVTVFFLSLILMSAGHGWAQDDEVKPEAVEAEEPVTDTGAVGSEKGPVVVHNKICPVSGAEVGSMGEGATREYNGKIYHFCCPMCFNDFDLDPEKYVAIIEEAMAKEAAQGGGTDEEMQEPPAE